MSDGTIKLTPPTLPALPQPRAGDPHTQRLYDSIKEYLETVRGARGNPLDRAVFIRDLVATGILSYSGGRIGPGTSIPGDIGDIDGSNDTTTPPRLTNIQASAGFSHVLITWDDPHYSRLKYYEVWRKTVDTGIDIEDNQNYYYNLRITNDEIEEMQTLFGLGDTATLAQQRLRSALDVLLAVTNDYYPKFWESALDEDNTTKRDTLIASSELLKAARVEVEAARSDDPGSGAIRIGVTVAPMLSDPVDRGRSYLYWVRAVSTALIPGPFNAEGVLAKTAPDIEAIMLELTREINNSFIADFIFNGINMQGYAGFGQSVTLGENIVQQQAWINDMNAGWGVRIEISANGKPYAVGFGLNVDITNPNDPESTFLVVADRFAILDPDATENEIAPFIVAEDPDDPGIMKVWINQAMINRAYITELIAGYVVADFIDTAALLSAAHINSSTINIGTINKPDESDPTTWTYNPTTGRQGNFSVDEAGIMHANLAVLNGVVIRDTEGNIILDTVTGTYGSALVSRDNPINSSNVGTFISRLAVNTLHIAGNAVTVPEASMWAGTLSPSASAWSQITDVTMELDTTGEVLVDEDVPVLIQWSVEAANEVSNPRVRFFRIRQVCASLLPEDQVIYQSFSGSRNVDQYNGGNLKATVQAGEETTWYLEVKGTGTVYQASLVVTAVRR